jgi:hypothetical protein
MLKDRQRYKSDLFGHYFIKITPGGVTESYNKNYKFRELNQED